MFNKLKRRSCGREQLSESAAIRASSCATSSCGRTHLPEKFAIEELREVAAVQ